jgi:hypothetical protein
MGTSFASISAMHFVYQDKNSKKWRKFMKLTMKLFLALTLLCANVMAEGEMGGGGYTGCTTDCPPPCTENCRMVPASHPVITPTDRIVIMISKFIPWMF